MASSPVAKNLLQLFVWRQLLTTFNNAISTPSYTPPQPATDNGHNFITMQ